MLYLNDVSFAYSKRSEPVLKHVSIQLEEGKVGVLLVLMVSERAQLLS